MSFVMAVPETVAAAATDLESIGSTLRAAHAAAAAPTSGILAAAADEVSTAVASLFSTHGQAYQSMSAQAAAFQADFVQAVRTAALSYAAAEAANASPLQGVLNAVNAPVQALLGQAGGAGGLSALAGSWSATGGLGSLGGLGTLGSLGTGGTPNAVAALESLMMPGPLGTLGNSGALAALAPLAAVPAVAVPMPVMATYAQLIQNSVVNLQMIAQTWLAHPAPFLHQVILNQIGYATLIAQSFGNAASHLPPAFQALLNLDFGTAAAQLVGALAELTPILNIPGQILQNITNVYNAITNFTVSLSTAPVMLTFGLPVALLVDALGSLITTQQAIGVSTNLLFAPSTIANGFLNGTGALVFGVTAPGGSSLTVALPAFGLLNPQQGNISATLQLRPIGPIQLPPIEIPVPPVGPIQPPPIVITPPPIGPITLPPIDVTIPGTPITGLVPALVNFAPEQLAIAIGAQPPVVP